MPKYKKNNRNKKFLFIVVLLIVLAIVSYFVYQKATTKDDVAAADTTTSSAPSAQEDFKDGDNRSPASNDSEKGSASVSDNRGQQVAVPDQSQWSTSKTSEITVYGPAKNQVVTRDTALSGASTLDIVYYRVIDDVSGMIAQGQLSVVNGKFSGTLSFATSANTGRIDVYGAQDSGKEFGNVEVPIRFK